ncbi:MAG: NADH-quinone oxidoreductase subunit N [Caldilineaceae bacterium]|nr:NADH-quinone oxidoreductase subunit N [Caldilineaceae bacterium]MCB9139248.1 NADH-quinone oxidoreductase subunit N [Caldilineaceae bacterium]
MEQVTIGELGSILPELILLTGGLLILILDMVQSHGTADSGISGRGFMLIAVLFLAVGSVAVILQFDAEQQLALSMIMVDKFSAFLKVVIYVGMTLVAIAGGGYMNRRMVGHGEFWMLFMFVTIAMSFAVGAADLLMIFLTIEFLSITSYILVGFLRTDVRSTEAGVKYFLYGSVASSVMLFGMSLLYGASGSLNLAEIAAAFAASPERSLVIVPATLMMLVGLGFKTSLAPFFQWTPDTYEGAPTPVTAYLSTASKAVGFAVMARVLVVGLGAFQASWVPILAGLSMLTMFAGNLMALRQPNVKRMLAYSSVAQAGYILLGLVAVVDSSHGNFASLTNNGLNGVLIYLFAYLFTNIGAFMVIMLVEEATGSSDISAFEGLSQRAPGMAWGMFIFLLSLTGIPLTGGFMGKFYVFGATVQHQYYTLAVIAAINAGIAAFYYLNVVRAMFFTEAEQDEDGKALPLSGQGFAPATQLIVLVCVAVTLWLGVYPMSLINWASDASQNLLTIVF